MASISAEAEPGHRYSAALLRSAVIAALGGFLFGFDTVVISGAEQTIQSLWDLSAGQHGLAMSAALWGTVLGSLIGGWPTDAFGRRPTLLVVGVLYFISAVWSGLAGDVNSFMIARLIGGLGIGISTVASPLYISEISPPALRGRLAGMFQFNIVFGILIAFVSNWVIGNYVAVDAWRWMLGIEAVPALIYTVCCFAIPESPRWLIAKRGDRAAGLKVLERIDPDADDSTRQRVADEIARGRTDAAEATSGGSRFWSARLKTPILLAFLIAFFNQLSGINAVLYFAPRIIGLTGLDESAARFQSVGIGLTNLLFTFVGLYLIDRLGRRTLLLIGSLGYIASLGTIGVTFITGAAEFDVAGKAMALDDAVGQLEAADREPEEAAELETRVEEARTALESAASDASVAEMQQQAERMGVAVLLGIIVFIAAHAVGQGAVIWVFIAEIFPNEHRAAGQSLGSFTHWIFAATLTLVFPKLVVAFSPGAVFLFFCGMMALQLVWVLTAVPETKNVPLEEMQEKLGVK